MSEHKTWQSEHSTNEYIGEFSEDGSFHGKGIYIFKDGSVKTY